MRSVFTVSLPFSDGEFPSTIDILTLVRSYGWEPVEIGNLGSEEEKLIAYSDLAKKLFDEMPEIAKEEKDSLIFFGYITDDQTKFVITRRVQGQITFRLLHPILPRLQSSTRKIVKKILASKLNDLTLEISNQSGVIYERGHDHIILSGRVIPDPIREAFRSDRKNVLLLFGPMLLSIPVFWILSNDILQNHLLISSTLERASTALLTTALVSALGLFQTYYEIRRHKLIVWNFTVDARVS